jgi:tetratricopeptide (TPR) repeat protein
VSFFRRLFSKSPADLLAKGDRLMESECFFDARTCYEDGLRNCSDKEEDIALKPVFIKNIDDANYKLAERNIEEAEFAYSRGEAAKAIDHLELVKSLTYAPDLREKAETLLHSYKVSEDDLVMPPVHSSCASCVGSSAGECSDNVHPDVSLSLLEYYELLIQQLPSDQYQRYAQLGEEFAYAYSAASRDEHQEALVGLEKSSQYIPRDIYCYEKGKVLHRLANDTDAEQYFRTAIELNPVNSLAWLALALLQIENRSFNDAVQTVETMIVEQIMPEQALLMRAEIYEATGDHETAVNQYVELLQTPYSRAAAERLYGLLQGMGRHADAAVIFKKYLNKSCH